MILPVEAQPLLAVLLPHFAQPTATRFVTLLVAAVLTPGRRTGANLLRTLGPLARGHRTTYQRVLSRAPWSTAALGTALTGFILRQLVPDGPVVLVGDDTVDGHPGPKVYGKARHRDPVRSAHSHTYGTIVIDLERGTVIDLLSGRDGEALKTWLEANPQVEVITRDRWPAYIQAATTAAPQAKQVADC